MENALILAEAAAEKGEVPVAAIIVKDGECIADGINTREIEKSPTGHAEINAIQSAAKAIGDWRLTDSTLYVTLEPCPMCMGAIIHARIPRLVFAAKDKKWGACGSACDLHQPSLFNHTVEINYQPHPRSQVLLQDFFKALRQNSSYKKQEEHDSH